MPEYLAPGVYIEELSTGAVPIEGVSTSTAGFVGQTVRGPVQPTLVTSFVEYQRWFGGFLDPSISFLPFAAKGFFDNGGQRLFVSRVVGAGSLPSTLKIDPQLTLEAIGPGDWGNRLFARVKPSTLKSNGTPVGFHLTLLYYNVPPPTPLVDPTDPNLLADPNRREPSTIEDYDNLRIDPSSQDYPLTVINPASQLVGIPVPTAPIGLPATIAFTPLAGGGDGTTPLTSTQYLGDGTLPVNQRTGLAGLETINDISILAVPDEVKFPDVTTEIINQCERLRYRFGILQFPAGTTNVSAMEPPQDSSYGAIYYPWVRVLNPSTLDYPLVPATGHVAGIYARTDIERGVHKAPANADVRGIVTRDIDSQRKPLEFLVPKGQQDILNPKGINVIRDFRSDGRGIRVWGARTMSTDSQWRYINVRRLFIFLEQSIDRGTQWLVFEPNDEPTWARVRRSITNFLITVWHNGALMGTTQEEAFFVKCDRTTMTQDDLDNGRLICYIGVAPVKPAEFVIFRFSQKTIEATQP
jgi:uncharacterized protein